MSNETDYNEMTVPELRELAEERGVHVPSTATKADIIVALKGKKGAAKGAPERDEDAVNKQAAEEIEKQATRQSYEDFADPVTDGSKPILDLTTPSNVVQVLVFDGSNILTLPPEAGPPVDHLVFVQSGRSQEWLIPEAAKRKFGQDKEGQIYYNQHGLSDEYKPIDCVELGT
jgi:hypothetical protein